MSYSHNKYRQKEYRQRDRQYQYHNYYSRKKNRHDRDRYYDGRYNRKPRYHDQNSRQQQHHSDHQQLQYYHESSSYSNGQQYYDNHYDTHYNNHYDNHAEYYEYEDDWRYNDDDDEQYIPPLSPLDLERKEYQLYIKKNSALHHIYLYQSDIKTKNQNVTNSLDIRAMEVKTVNSWNKYVNISNSIKQCYADNNLRSIDILEIGCGNGNNLEIYRENAHSISSYIGIDASAECIETAMKYKSLSSSFLVDFIVCDIFDSKDVLNDALLSNKRFDLIHIDLSSLHNAFKSDKTLLMFLNLISSLSQNNSLLICSFVRDDIIIDRFNKLSTKNSILNIMSVDKDDNMLWQNRYQSISMKRKDFNLINNNNNEMALVAIPLINHTVDTNTNTIYFICFQYLSKMLCKHCNMKLVYRHNANDIYSKYSNSFSDLNGKMLSDSNKWSKDEREVIETYGYALFKRKE